MISEGWENEKVEMIRQHTWDITMVYLRVLVETHIPLFRQRWTMMQYADLVNGFVAGLHSGVTVPVRVLPDPYLGLIDFE